MKDYKVLKSRFLAGLEEEVNDFIKKGYRPYGNIFIFNTLVCQAMVLRSYEEV